MTSGAGVRVALPGRTRRDAPGAHPAHHIRNIVVCGGSYGGMHCASHLAEHLPPGYRVILIERNSHFNRASKPPPALLRYSTLCSCPYTAC